MPTKTCFGGVLEGQRDAGGQMYMRNRYYDPATGQFTQTDSIGIAGGLNTYGFAGGDPVTYSDPYGLCKQRTGIGRVLNLFDKPCSSRDEAARRALAEVRERPGIGIENMEVKSSNFRTAGSATLARV